MTGETVGGLLGALAALWNADGLEAWIFKLIGVLAAVLVVTALFSRAGSPGGAAKPVAGRPRNPHTGQTTAGRPRIQSRSIPPKNRKKKRERIVRRYRPRSHSGSLRPLTRRVALKLVETAPARPVASPVRRTAL